jgi:serine phosphatase RsbU (regulator of sigma subunit)
MLDGVLDAVDRWAGGAEQSDDITLLAVRRLPGGS